MRKILINLFNFVKNEKNARKTVEIHRNGEADLFQTGGDSGCPALEYLPYSRRQKQAQFRIHRKVIAAFSKAQPGLDYSR